MKSIWKASVGVLMAGTMLFTGAFGAMAADQPDEATPVVDFTYLPHDQALGLANDLGGVFNTAAVTSKDLVVSVVKDDGKDWLKYERKTTTWNAGIYLDLIRAKAKNKAITDWNGATTLWFYAKATGSDVYMNIVLATDNEESGQVQGYFNSEEVGLKYRLQEGGSYVEKTTTEDNYKHILLPGGYEGWVGFDIDQLVCKSGHLKNQKITAHLGDIFGVGFYVEGGNILIRDICATGAVNKIGEAPKPTTATTAGKEESTTTSAADTTSTQATEANTNTTTSVTTTTAASSTADTQTADGEAEGFPVVLIVLLCVAGAGAIGLGVFFVLRKKKQSLS